MTTPIQQNDHSNEIAEVAYAYWLSRGCEDGHDVEDWLMAEKEVQRRHGDRIQADHKEPHLRANAA